MSKWNETFSTSSFVTVFTTINEKFNPDNILVDLEDSQVLESYNRLIKSIEYIKSVIKSIDPELIPISSISDLDALANQLLTSIDTYNGTFDYAALETLNNSIDIILAKINSMQQINLGKGVDTFIQDASHFRQITEQIIAGLKSSADITEAQLKEATNSFNTEAANVTTALKTTTSDMDVKFKELKTSIDAQKVRTDELIANYQKQFSDSEQQRISTFQSNIQTFNKETKDKIQEITNDSKAIISKFEKETQDAIADYHKDSDQLIIDLEKSKKQASDLVRIISNIGVTGNFNKMATSDRRWAISLRFIALVFMAILVGGAIYTVHIAITQTEGFDWRIVLFRIMTIFTLAVPAIYAARESEKHRNSEHKYRKMELELASIDPYLESLPDEEKVKLKASFAERVFGQPEPGKVKDQSIKVSNLYDLLEKVIDKALSKK